MSIFSQIARVPVNMHFLAPPQLQPYTPNAPGTNGIGTPDSAAGQAPTGQAQATASPVAGGAVSGAPPAPSAGLTGGNGGIMNALMKLFGGGGAGGSGGGLDPSMIMSALGMMG